MPPLIDKGAGVFRDVPIFTPESKSLVKVSSPLPFGVRVRSSLVSVVISVKALSSVRVPVTSRLSAISTPSVLSTIVPPLSTNPPVEEKVSPVVPDVVILPVVSTWNASAVPEYRVPLTSTLPVTFVLPLMFVASCIVTNPVPESITMFPVVTPPRVRVFMFRDWMVEFSEDRLIPLPLVFADRVASGAPEETLVIAKRADWVEEPPILKS